MNATLVVLLPLFTAAISAYIAHGLTRRNQRDFEATKFKEQAYINLLMHLTGFLQGSSSRETQEKFLAEMYKSWVYCSDDVVIAINDLLSLVGPQRQGDFEASEGKKALGNIVLAMRRDLHGKTSLSAEAFQYYKVLNDT